MATKLVCDRCGKEMIVPRRLVKEGSVIKKRYDLCGDCYTEFDEWLENKKEPEWTGEGD